MKRSITVPGKGPGKADYMFIGEAPGATEELRREPFCGRSGNILNVILEHLGVMREEVYITNLVKIRPPNNTDPTAEMIKEWAPKLAYEIQNVQPTVIFTLGKYASAHMLEEKRIAITKVMGKQQVKRGKIIIPLYHPAYILRNPKKLQEVLDVVIKIRDMRYEQER